MSVSVESLGIDRLSVAERLALIEEIWDSLPEEVNAADVPEWHRAELARRRADAKGQVCLLGTWHSKHESVMGNKSVSRYENVQFHFLGTEEDCYLAGTVIDRGADMVLDIRGGMGPYHIIGKALGHAFSGDNDHPERRFEVNCKWADVGGLYVGIWIEDGYEYLFSFTLNTAK